MNNFSQFDIKGGCYKVLIAYYLKALSAILLSAHTYTLSLT